MKSLRELAKIAKEHHEIPEYKKSTRHIGIFYTTIAWSLYAIFTVLIEKLNPNFSADTSSKAFSRSFFEFGVLHFSMFIVFFAWSLKNGGIKHFSAVEPRLIWWRSIFAVLSFWFYALARIWTNTIDNTYLYSTDAFWIILMLLYLNIKIRKLSFFGISVGFIGIVYGYFSDSKSIHDLFGGVFGLFSGITLAIITIFTAFLIKQDPPERIGLYQSILGCVSSFILSVIFGLIEGFEFPSQKDILITLINGVIFSIFLYWVWKSFYYTEPYILGALSYILPVFLVGAEWILGGESMNRATIIGTLIITIGGVIVIFDSAITHKKPPKKGVN